MDSLTILQSSPTSIPSMLRGVRKMNWYLRRERMWRVGRRARHLRSSWALLMMLVRDTFLFTASMNTSNYKRRVKVVATSCSMHPAPAPCTLFTSSSTLKGGVMAFQRARMRETLE